MSAADIAFDLWPDGSVSAQDVETLTTAVAVKSALKKMATKHKATAAQTNDRALADRALALRDGGHSLGVAKRELLLDVEHRESRYLKNRAENSHQPTRRRERQMQRFKSTRQAQRFLFAHALISGHFRPRRHRMTASHYRSVRAYAFKIWAQQTCAKSVG